MFAGERDHLATVTGESLHDHYSVCVGSFIYEGAKLDQRRAAIYLLSDLTKYQ